MKKLLAAAFALGLLLFGCAGEEYVYTDDADLKSGHGLFSGEDGVFTIYGKTPSEQPTLNSESLPESMGD